MGALVDRLNSRPSEIAELLRVGSAPGLSMGVFHEGRIVYTNHMGRRDINFPDSPNDDSIYCVASTFKIVTACAIARLVADGLLDWNTPIREYIPLRRQDEFGLEATLRDLLSNRTGLPMASSYWGQQNGEQLLPKSEFLNIVDDMETVERLGTTFIYSQWNYCLLQLIVEKISGKSFGVFVREAIFEPLGLTSATFDQPAGTNIMMPHANLSDGMVKNITTSTFDSSSGLAAGTGGKTSLKDQLTLYIALMNAYQHQTTNSLDATPNSPFTHLRTIFTPHVPIGGSAIDEQAYCLGLYRTRLPGNLSCASLNGALPRKDLPVFGALNLTQTNEEIFHHTANFPGFVGSMFLVPRMHSGVVVMANATPIVDVPDFIAQLLLSDLLSCGPPPNLLSLAQKSAQMQLGWFEGSRAALRTFKTDLPPTHPLETYAGVYLNRIRNFKIVVKALQKSLCLSMQGLSTAYEVQPLDGDSFYFDADRDFEIVDRGMWINPLPQFHVFHFNVSQKCVHSLTWKHDRLMEAEVFAKDNQEQASKL
ncbi:beta-lactamase/transpeptidase-like protein [Clohesyomyces aquaticus]|uniref:Beta-lactamase/transpeptidase-like protein n=1 Tax=Clohesyomyces aquaticus TaxID=1231657 RepID=A0A1Y1Y7Q8_9PLEO|nr:beta-lactamase/transpeptidase-like protein [Clohesyomyces aquaticus]